MNWYEPPEFLLYKAGVEAGIERLQKQVPLPAVPPATQPAAVPAGYSDIVSDGGMDPRTADPQPAAAPSAEGEE